MFSMYCFYRKYLEHYIEHMPIETQRKAEKILTICEKRNMSEHGKSHKNFYFFVSFTRVPLLAHLFDSKVSL